MLSGIIFAGLSIFFRSNDFNEYFDVGLPDDEFDTVGGLVVSAFGRLPEINETETINKFKFKVTGADTRKITRVQVSIAK